MPKLLFLADINSAHTEKWITSLVNNGFEVGIICIHQPERKWFNALNIKLFDAHSISSTITSNRLRYKINYLRVLIYLRKVIHEFKPDIVHAHYATSYGLLGALSGFHPFIISVWGSDVFDFPNFSFLHKYLFKNNLRKANCILSTSNIMKVEAEKYTDKEILVTPFGVNTNSFKPEVVKPFINEHTKVIGIVKALEDVYGIDILIKAFAEIKKKYVKQPIHLLIVGKGSQELQLKALVKTLGLSQWVTFTGKIQQDLVPQYQNMIDIFVCVSLEESFGVSVVEAMACAKPVVVSSVGGLKEVVTDNETGLIVAPQNVQQTTDAILLLLNNAEIAKQMGNNARERVLALYDWNENLKEIINIYQDILNRANKSRYIQ